ncbi:MAG: iron chelate uptake ABC transporter family permease subunit [Treponema sp.]|nr:iron chelate uptake ABC transporter family permease subunit [Treponema sp.]
MNENRRYCFFFSSLFAFLVILIFLSLHTGNVWISAGKILGIITGSDFAGAFSFQEANIVLKIRLPRLIMAGVLGVALSL